jgi:hypothetical protein
MSLGGARGTHSVSLFTIFFLKKLFFFSFGFPGFIPSFFVYYRVLEKKLGVKALTYPSFSTPAVDSKVSAAGVEAGVKSLAEGGAPPKLSFLSCLDRFLFLLPLRNFSNVQTNQTDARAAPPAPTPATTSPPFFNQR